MLPVTVANFIEKHRIAALTTPLQNGALHPATVHYAYAADPLSLFILTERGTRKLQSLSSHKTSPAAIVIGFSEEEWCTLQMEGTIQIVSTSSAVDHAWLEYAKKYPGAEQWKDSPESTMLLFTPGWWRYTELKPSPGKIITSEDI